MTELAARAKKWMQENDGGQLGAWWPAGAKPGGGSQPILAVMWDHGGTDELGVFYEEKDIDKLELICDLANYAMQQLVPTEREYYGGRNYEPEVV